MKTHCYLKVNREDNRAYQNLFHWITVFQGMPEMKLYLLCDKVSVIEEIKFAYPAFYEQVEILSSEREDKELQWLLSKICSEKWRPAGCAHLTTFLHAKASGCSSFWNIDADDTYLALEDEKCRELLQDVHDTGLKKGIHAFSLDMHFSRLEGMHWSFGITWTSNETDWFDVLRRYSDSFSEMRNALGINCNVDWYFTYLRLHSPLRLESFYGENLRFIHFSDDMITSPVYSGVYYWENGRLISPILRDVLGAKQVGDIPIHPEVLRLGTKIDREEGIACLQKRAGIREVVERGYTNIEEKSFHWLIPWAKRDGENSDVPPIENFEKFFLVEDGSLKAADGSLPADLFYVLFPGGIGDTLYALGFLSVYKERYAQGKAICAVVEERQAPLLRWYPGVVDQAIVSAQVCEWMNQYVVKKRIWQLDNFFYAHFQKDLFFMRTPEYDTFAGQSMIERWRELVFRLPSDTVWSPPVVPKASEELAQEVGVDKRTVILMPYAVSAGPLPTVFWESIAKALVKLGYRVLTNIAGAHETPIGETSALSIDIEKMGGLCEHALAVIALRSGMCDMLAFTDTMLFVLNTSESLQGEWNLSHVTSREGIINYLCVTEDEIVAAAEALLSIFVDAAR